MDQITITLPLTENTLELLKQFLPNAEDAVEDAPEPKEKPAAKALKAKEPESEPVESAKAEEPDAKALSITDVRALALELSKAGKQAELREVFRQYGAEKLSGIPESAYPALMVDLEALNG